RPPSWTIASASTSLTGKPLSAYPIAGARARSRPRRPWSATRSAIPASSPGTVATAAPCAGKPVAKASGSSRCGAAPEPLYTAISRDSALYVSANMSPPIEVRCGMTTAHTAAAATAASAALPPSRRAARPADVASGCPLATKPFAARTVGRVVKSGRWYSRGERDRDTRHHSGDRGDTDTQAQRAARPRDHRRERECEQDESEMGASLREK